MTYALAGVVCFGTLAVFAWVLRTMLTELLRPPRK